MAVPPAVPESEQARPYFKAMREMLLALRDKQIPRVQMRELSIGMSHDYEVAIQEDVYKRQMQFLDEVRATMEAGE